mgnify:CR=1 FL=1
MSDAGVSGAISSDADLLAAVRGGDSSAFAELYERHAPAARKVARQYASSDADAEDITSDAFAKVFSVVQGGGGPEEAFRAYLFTVVRRLAYATAQGTQRVQVTDEVATFESAFGPAGSVEEPALEGFERSVVARAYNSLPERWQAVLWYTEVEGLSAAEIAPLLGLTANGVSALSYRAREGLREAYLQSHLATAPGARCEAVAGKLGSYVRGGLSNRDTSAVESHLEGCTACQALVAELSDVNHGMRAIVAPLVLGLVGAGALKAGALGFGGQVASAGGAGAAGAAGATGGAAAGGVAVGAGGGLAGLVAATPVGVLVAAAAAVVGVVGVAIAAGLGAFSSPAAIPISAGTEQSQESPAPEEPSQPPAPSPSAPPADDSSDQETEDPLDEPPPGTDPTPAPTPAPTPTPSPTPDPDDGDDGEDPEPPGDDDPPGDDEPPGDDDPPPGDDDPPGEEDPGEEEPGAPELRFAQEIGSPVSLRFGEPATIDLSLTNGGSGTVQNLAATIELPPGVSAVVSDAASVRALSSPSGAGVVQPAMCGSGCSLGSLGPGETVELRIVVEVAEDAEPADTAIRVSLSGTGLSGPPLKYPVVIEAQPARILATISPSEIELDRSGAVSTIPISLENVSRTSATQVEVAVTLPSGVAWQPGRAQEALSPACAVGDLELGPQVVCSLAELPGRSGSLSHAVLLELPVTAEPWFESGEVVVEVTAAEAAAPASARAQLIGVGEAPRNLSPRASVILTEVPWDDDLFAVRLVIDLSADVAESTPGALYVDLPEGLSFEPGAGEQSVTLGGCTEVDPGTSTGACAVSLRPDAAQRITFRVVGEAGLVREWLGAGLPSALSLGVEELLESVLVTVLDPSLGQSGAGGSY